MGSELKIVLASTSPRRRILLKELKLDFIVAEPLSDEISNHPNPVERVVRNAELKAKSVVGLYPDSLIIGADTIVYLDGTFIGKPKSHLEAEKTLDMLSGKTHQVYTGITVLNTSNGEMLSGVSRTDVQFKNLCSDIIKEYIASGEPMDKAGSYAIQGKGGAFIQNYYGSYSNVVGLPLDLVEEFIQKLGD